MRFEIATTKEKVKGALLFFEDVDWHEVLRFGSDALRFVRMVRDLWPNKRGVEKGAPEPVIIQLSGSLSTGSPRLSASLQVVAADEVSS